MGSEMCIRDSRKGSAITTPKYKNLDEWSLDDLLVLLGSIGGLLGFK